MTTLTIAAEMARTVSQALLAPVRVAAEKVAADLDAPAAVDALFSAMFPIELAATAENLELIRLSREVVGLPCDAAMCVQCWDDLIDMYRADQADADGFVQGALGDA